MIRPLTVVALAVAASTATFASAQQIQTIAGNGTQGFSGDFGLATDATLAFPMGVAKDQAGNVLIADQHNHRVRKVSPTGIITTVAGTGTAGFSGDGGPATSGLYSLKYYQYDGPDCYSSTGSVWPPCYSGRCIDESCAPSRRRT